MADFSLQGDGQDYYQADRAPGTTPIGTQCVSSGSDNTKGAWATLPATTFDSSWLMVHLNQIVSVTGVPAATVKVLLDIGIGPPGSEQVIVPDLSWMQTSDLVGQAVNATFMLPLALPSGAALSIRCQSSTGAPVTVTASYTAIASGWCASAGHNDIEAFGVVAATSEGTNITPGNGIWGSYVELTASSSFKTDWLAISAQIRGSYPLPNTTHEYLLDIAVGGAGAEVTLIDSLPLAFNEQGLVLNSLIPPLPVSIPAGSRVACRLATTTVGTNLSVIAYAIGG